MYAEAEPGLDIDDVIDNPDDYGDEWFMNHSLDNDRQREIFDEHVEQYDLTQGEIASLQIVTMCDLAPTDESG